jgi:anti-anti-sigma factor
MATSPQEQFSISRVPGAREVVVVPMGDLDLASADALERAVRTLPRDGGEDLVIDLRRLDYLDSTGLRVLLELRREAERDGLALKLVPGPPAVQRVFQLTGTRGAFDWRDY